MIPFLLYKKQNLTRSYVVIAISACRTDVNTMAFTIEPLHKLSHKTKFDKNIAEILWIDS